MRATPYKTCQPTGRTTTDSVASDPVLTITAIAPECSASGLSREGVEIDVSTMADWIGACTATLAPLIALIEAHVTAAERVQGDDTTVPVLAKGKTATGRLWTHVRDDHLFGGPEPPAAVSYYSRDRRGEHPNKHLAGYAGIR